MQDNLKSYSQYKASDIPWLGLIPSHWGTHKIRHVVELLVSNVDKIFSEKEVPVKLCNYTDVYKNERITEKLKFMKASASKEEIIKFKIRVGDVIITKDSESWNDIGIPSLVVYEEDNLLCGYHLAILHPKKILNGNFLLRLLQDKNLSYQFHILANGVTRYGLSHNSIKDIRIIVPPIPEQHQIARYLDWKTSQISKFIKAKKRLIELLKEQKQVIINDAVTGKIDVRTGKPYPKYKNSVVEWLGVVPEEWEVRKVKNISKNIIGGSTPSSSNETYWDGEIIWITPSDISKNFQLNDSNRKITLKGLKSCSTQLVPKGSIIITCRAPVGNIGIANVELCTNQGCKSIIFADSLIINTYLAEILKLNQQNFNNLSDGTTFKELSIQKLKDFKIPVPPIKLQKDIMDWNKKIELEFNSTIAETENGISLLNEYRTRLIADVVTGKVDVRDIAVPVNTNDNAIDASVEEECVEETDE